MRGKNVIVLLGAFWRKLSFPGAYKMYIIAGLSWLILGSR